MNIQKSYEQICNLTNTSDIKYNKCMLAYKKEIEENFNVQTIIEFTEYQEDEPKEIDGVCDKCNDTYSPNCEICNLFTFLQ